MIAIFIKQFRLAESLWHLSPNMLYDAYAIDTIFKNFSATSASNSRLIEWVNSTFLLSKTFGWLTLHYKFGVQFWGTFLEIKVFISIFFSKLLKRVGLLFLYFSMKKKSEIFNIFFIMKNDFENQNFVIFEAIFIIRRQSVKDLLK